MFMYMYVYTFIQLYIFDKLNGSRTTPHQIKIKRNYCRPGPESVGLLPTRTTTYRKTTHQDK